MTGKVRRSIAAIFANRTERIMSSRRVIQTIGPRHFRHKQAHAQRVQMIG